MSVGQGGDMFERKRPCANCPFRKGQGELYQLNEARLAEIFEAPAFQCHKTVDYNNHSDPRKRQGNHPQQCAGLMAVLHADGVPNQIMQVAMRLSGFRPEDLDLDVAYNSREAARLAHSSCRSPSEKDATPR